jgi:hypothetical protein
VIRALSLGCLCLCACDWLTASSVESTYCAEFEKLPATTERVALLQPCTTASDCPCAHSLCLTMAMPDGGAERRCDPPDSARLPCPLFYDSNVVLWQQNDECLETCTTANLQCVGHVSGGHACTLGRCQ